MPRRPMSVDMRPIPRSVSQRCGATIIYTTLGMGVLLGFGSLAVDFGRVQVVKTQLERAADAAASTGCLPGNTGACALIGLNGITMSGNAFTDSYNSSNGAYSAGAANKKGAIASNGNIALSNFATVNGDVRCGIGMTTTTSG